MPLACLAIRLCGDGGIRRHRPHDVEPKVQLWPALDEALEGEHRRELVLMRANRPDRQEFLGLAVVAND